jgi:CBS domain-containing protein/serine/threonine protein phosphatase PrpC
MANNRANRGVIMDPPAKSMGTIGHGRAGGSSGHTQYADPRTAFIDYDHPDAAPPQSLASSLSINDVLTHYQADGRTYTCRASSSLYEAVALMVASRVGCLVAMEEDGEHVAGLITERDIMSEMVRLQEAAVAESASSGVPKVPDWTKVPVSAAMTRSREMVHCRPSDLIDDALTLMTSQGFRHLPVLDQDNSPGGDGAHLRGMVSMRNLVDILYMHKGAGGKAQFLNDILPRTGMPKHTRALRKRRPAATAADGTSPTAELLVDDPPRPSLFLNAGVWAVPHPDKKVGEDSYVTVVANANTGAPIILNTSITVPHESGSVSMSSTSIPSSSAIAGVAIEEELVTPYSILAVFDGVGSWSFEKGLDYPAKFSNALAEGLKEYIENHPALSKAHRHPPIATGEPAVAAAAVAVGAADAANPNPPPAPSSSSEHSSPSSSFSSSSSSPISAAVAAVSPGAGATFVPGALSAPALSPAALLGSAWSRVCKDKVAGSATACILSLAHHSNELRAANIGDSGFLVLRQRDAQRLGSVGMASRRPMSHPGSRWQVIYRSPQQLHYFNCPLQIGVGPSGETDQFESPLDADLLSVPLQVGDIILLATDGLFDNVPEESIVDELARAMDLLEEQQAASLERNTVAAALAADAVTKDLAAAAVTVSAITGDRPHPFSVTSVSESALPRIEGPVSPLTGVAAAVGRLAQRLSLDKMIDSPFALLAKDNNILWKNGGRKDDITVIVARVDPVV